MESSMGWLFSLLLLAQLLQGPDLAVSAAPLDVSTSSVTTSVTASATTSGSDKLSQVDADFLAFVASYGRPAGSKVDAATLMKKGTTKDLVKALGQLPDDLKAKVSSGNINALTAEDFNRLCFMSDWCGLLPGSLLFQLIRINPAAATDPAFALKNPPAVLRIVDVVVRSSSSGNNEELKTMMEVLKRTKLPDVYWFVKAVTRLARANASWIGDIDGIWSSNRRLLEFQFDDTLADPDVSGAIINSGAIEADIRQNNRLTEMGLPERITWRNTVYKRLPTNATFANPFYYPLIVGYSERDLADWMLKWNQEKHDQALALLTTSNRMLTAPQVQRLTSKFNWKPETLNNPNVRKFRLEILDKLDLKQLDDLANITMSELISKPDLSYPAFLKLIDNDLGGAGIPRFIPKGLANFSLAAYPATQIMAAVVSKDLEVDKAALINITSPYLTLAQSLVLFDSYVRNLISRATAADSGPLSAVDYLDIPRELLNHMPFYPILGLDDSMQVRDRLSPLVERLDGMLPSQRLAIIWKLSKLISNTDAEIDTKAEMVQIATGALTSSFNSSQTMSFIRFMSSKVYQMTSLFEKLQLKPASSFVALNPLSGISCSILDQLDTSKMVSIMSTYDLMVSTGSSDRTIVFLRPSERKCFMKKFRQYLAMKAEIVPYDGTNNVTFGMLTPDEVLSVGGSFFTDLTFKELDKQVPDPLLGHVVFALGRVSLPQLMPLAGQEWLEAAAKLFIERMPLNDKHKLDSLTSLGNLAMFLGEDLQQFEADHLKLWLEVTLLGSGRAGSSSRLSKCACLTSKHATGLKKALYLAYGAPNSWTTSQILRVSNLLWILGDNLGELNQEELRKAAPFLLKSSCSAMDFDYFPGFVGNGIPYDQACYEWLGGNGNESAEGYRVYLDKLMRALLISSQISVDLASAAPTPLAPSGRADVSSTNTSQGSGLGSTNSSNTFSLLYNRTLEIIKAKFTSGTITQDQIKALGETNAKVSREYKDKLAEILKIPANEVDLNQLSKMKNVSSIQMQLVREEGKRFQQVFILDMIQIFNLTREKDYANFSKADFCANVPCQEVTSSNATTNLALPFFIKYDSEFASRSNLDGLIKGPSVSMTSLLAASTTPVSITCNGIVASGVSARFLRRSDLDAWPARDLFYCSDVLGRTRFPAKSREEIWDLLFSKTRDLILDTSGKLKGATMIFLRQMLDTISVKNPEIMTFDRRKSIDAVSVLGTALDLPGHVSKALGDLYVSQNFPTTTNVNDGNKTNFPVATEVLALELATLGQIFCGLPLGLVEGVIRSSPARSVGLLSILGGLRQCQDRHILSTLADQADRELKGNWSPFDVSTMGIIVAGLTPQRLTSLSPDHFGSLTSTALGQLTSQHIVAMAPAQIRALPSEALGALRLGQLPLEKGSIMIDQDQMAAFEDLATEYPGFAKVLKEYKEALKQNGLEVLPRQQSPSPVVDRVDLRKQQQEATNATEATTLVSEPKVEAKPEAEAAASSASRPKNGFEMLLVVSVMFAVYLYLLFCCLEGHN